MMLRFMLAILPALGALPAQAIECRLALLLAMECFHFGR